MVHENKEFEPQEFGMGDPHAKDVGVEPDNPPVQTMFVQLAVSTVLVVAVVIGLIEFVKLDVRKELSVRDLAVPSKLLQEVRGREKALLTQYDAIDADKGVYQIPIDQAMASLLQSPALLQNVRTTGEGGPAFVDKPAGQAGASAPGATGAPAAPVPPGPGGSTQ